MTAAIKTMHDGSTTSVKPGEQLSIDSVGRPSEDEDGGIHFLVAVGSCTRFVVPKPTKSLDAVSAPATEIRFGAVGLLWAP